MIIFLEVPFLEEEEVQKLGAFWSTQNQKWYIHSENYEKFQKWIDTETLQALQNQQYGEITAHITIIQPVETLEEYAPTAPEDYGYKFGIEKGSATFAHKLDFARLQDKIAKQNIILSQDLRLSLNHISTGHNLNTLVVGNPGAGKTRQFVLPNILQMSANFVVTDPKGEILALTGNMLKQAGYEIKVLDLVNLQNSNYYNPFVYLRKDRQEDVLTLIKSIMKNVNMGKNGGHSDPFWDNAAILLIQAIFFYILYEEPPHNQNFGTVVDMLRMAMFEDEDNPTSPLDYLFLELKKRDEDHIAVVQYDLFKTAADKTLKSIVISAIVYFTPFSLSSVREMFSHDTFDLHSLDTKKVAIFVIISPTNSTFHFMAAMFYSQLFTQLDYIANWINPKKNLPKTLKTPMLMLLDEFANVGFIPDFDKILAYARSLNMGISIIVQSLSQLENMYGNTWQTLLDSCDTMIYLGGHSLFTLNYISEKLGNETLKTKNGEIIERKLMTNDEISRLPVDTSLIFMRTLKPFKGKKYVLSSHKNSRLLATSKNFYTHVRKKIKNAKSQNQIALEKLQDSVKNQLLKIFFVTCQVLNREDYNESHKSQIIYYAGEIKLFVEGIEDSSFERIKEISPVFDTLMDTILLEFDEDYFDKEKRPSFRNFRKEDFYRELEQLEYYANFRHWFVSVSQTQSVVYDHFIKLKPNGNHDDYANYRKLIQDMKKNNLKLDEPDYAESMIDLYSEKLAKDFDELYSTKMNFDKLLKISKYFIFTALSLKEEGRKLENHIDNLIEKNMQRKKI
ncbi:MAG: type IV secretory system conjugative DNA transfer family protein [Firmicutes bacterium]|nr:type IV secretory system conjugative DNA transfer family protein [Bacillota bacterium]